MSRPASNSTLESERLIHEDHANTVTARFGHHGHLWETQSSIGDQVSGFRGCGQGCIGLRIDDMYIQAYIPNTYIHTYVRTYVRTYRHTYIHTHTHTHTRTGFQDLSLGGSPVKVWSNLLATTEPTVRMNVKKS